MTTTMWIIAVMLIVPTVIIGVMFLTLVLRNVCEVLGDFLHKMEPRKFYFKDCMRYFFVGLIVLSLVFAYPVYLEIQNRGLKRQIETLNTTISRQKEELSKKEVSATSDKSTEKSTVFYCYVSYSGTKYHRYSKCYGEGLDVKATRKMTIEKAKEIGYTKCNDCW
jgi:uncharacterized membrane protein